MTEDAKKAKAYLREYETCQRILEADERILQSILCSLVDLHIAGDNSPVISSPGAGASYTELVHLKVDLEATIRDERRECDELRLQILSTICKVPDIMQRSVLHLRYIELLKWPEIADAMHYSERYCFRIHDKALEAVAVILVSAVQC